MGKGGKGTRYAVRMLFTVNEIAAWSNPGRERKILCRAVMGLNDEIMDPVVANARTSNLQYDGSTLHCIIAVL